jgi:hypothetical protein
MTSNIVERQEQPSAVVGGDFDRAHLRQSLPLASSEVTTWVQQEHGAYDAIVALDEVKARDLQAPGVPQRCAVGGSRGQPRRRETPWTEVYFPDRPAMIAGRRTSFHGHTGLPADPRGLPPRAHSVPRARLRLVQGGTRESQGPCLSA